MSQADAKDWGSVLFHGRSEVLDCLFHHGGITRTVGDEETIVVFASKTWEVIIPGADQDLYSSRQKASQLVVFQTNIQAQNTYRPARGMFESSRGLGGVEFGCFDRN